jgi:predicted O-methyltransferase YrrM
MADTLASLRAELERFGQDNDAAIADRSRRMLNITRDTGEFLSVWVRAANARRILEIGTSNGYSTLWLAEAAREIGGFVTTVELAERKVALASATFGRSGLAAWIKLVHDDAVRVLERSQASAFDLVFLDSERSEYARWWPELRRVIRPSGSLVVDNATSHVEEMAPLTALLAADPEFTVALVPVGKGELVAVKRASESPAAEKY